MPLTVEEVSSHSRTEQPVKASFVLHFKNNKIKKVFTCTNLIRRHNRGATARWGCCCLLLSAAAPPLRVPEQVVHETRSAVSHGDGKVQARYA